MNMLRFLVSSTRDSVSIDSKSTKGICVEAAYYYLPPGFSPGGRL